MESFPVLYVLMRTDLDSLNSGKGMAQAHHCGSAFAKQMNDSFFASEGAVNSSAQDLFNEWQLETSQGFGTVLVLGVTEAQMNSAVKVAQALDFVAGVVHDPTYPLVDGDTVHFLPIDTCGYVFGDKNDPMLQAVVGNFKLHP